MPNASSEGATGEFSKRIFEPTEIFLPSLRWHLAQFAPRRSLKNSPLVYARLPFKPTRAGICPVVDRSLKIVKLFVKL
jgi:hypothetical protein